LRERRRDDYRHELAWSEPGLNPDVAELAVAGFDSRLYYEWPLCRALVFSSRLVAVHGEATRPELVERLSTSHPPAPHAQAAHPQTAIFQAASFQAASSQAADSQEAQADGSRAAWLERIVSVRRGHGELVTADREAAARARVRAKYGIAPDAIVFGVFGGLTPEKRLPQILAAVRAILPYAPDARPLRGGEGPEAPATEYTGRTGDRNGTERV